jgi:microcystin-dependent protein
VPDGYLVCNGAEYPTSQYPDLFAAIQYDYGGSGANFRVPDYRAMFLRGLDEGRGIDPQRTISATFQKGSLHWSDSLSSPGSAPGDVGIYALTSGSSDTTASTNKNIGFDSYGAVRNFYQPSYVRTEFPAYTSKNTPVLASTIIGGTANYTEWLTLTGIGNLQWPDGYWKHDGLYGISRPHNMAVRYVIKAKATAGGGGYLAAPWIIKMNDSGLANGQLEAGTGIDLVLLPTGATQINAIGQGGGGAIAVQQNSVAKGAATTLNFVNSSISVAGSVATITGQAGGGDYAGTIKLWTGSTPPDPTYAFCDGSLVDRVQFATLFSRIGNTYGAGTATQFRLPDFRNRFAVGSGSTYSRGATGGSADAVVVSHRHQLRDPVSGAQFFGINDFLNSGVAPAGWQRNPPFASPTINSPLLSDPNSPWVGDGPSGTNDASLYGWTDTVGESGTNKNLPPYLSCFYVIKLTDDGFSTGSLAQGTGIVLTQLPNGQTQISATPVPSSGALSAWGTGTRAVIPSDNTAINFVGAYNISSGTFTKTVVTVGLQTSAYFTWRINFTTPMANTNYAVMTNFEGPVPDAYTGLTPVTVIEKTTTYFVARTPLASNAATPAPTIMVMVAGGV